LIGEAEVAAGAAEELGGLGDDTTGEDEAVGVEFTGEEEARGVVGGEAARWRAVGVAAGCVAVGKAFGWET
jgi:hypothetical protein